MGRSSVVLFTFLIVVLSLFVCLLVGGIIYHRVLLRPRMARLRELAREAEGRGKRKGEKKVRPKLWEVPVDRKEAPPSLVLGEGWDGLQVRCVIAPSAMIEWVEGFMVVDYLIVSHSHLNGYRTQRPTTVPKRSPSDHEHCS